MAESTELKQKMDVAEEFARKNIYDCVTELLEWQNTSLLKDGKVRELAKLCSFAHERQLAVAEAIIARQAYKSLITYIDWHRI